MGIAGAALDPSPNSTRYPSAPVAWLSETLTLNWTAAPRPARHGFTVRVTLRPPSLVVDVRCPAAGVAVPGTNAVASLALAAGMEGAALEVVAPMIATTAAALAANAALRTPRNLRRSPTHSGYRPWPRSAHRPSGHAGPSGDAQGPRRLIATPGSDNQFLGNRVFLGAGQGFRASLSEL